MVHWLGLRPNGPPPTMSVTGGKDPRLQLGNYSQVCLAERANSSRIPAVRALHIRSAPGPHDPLKSRLQPRFNHLNGCPVGCQFRLGPRDVRLLVEQPGFEFGILLTPAFFDGRLCGHLSRKVTDLLFQLLTP